MSQIKRNLIKLWKIPMPNKHLTKCKKSLFTTFNQGLPFNDFEQSLVADLCRLNRGEKG